ncbi:MAG: hypothetical protein KDB23_14245 [Planctomycetales bacterium]|nr:hypothetical protein [Planctomycetales bacterium]
MSQDHMIRLHAGPIDVDFCQLSGQLRGFRLRGQELLRAVYGAVRDHNWDTIEPRIENLSVRQSDTRFAVDFDALCQQGNVDFRWHGKLTGDASGTITMIFDGRPYSTFRRNRIGWCILHPLAHCSGQPCELTHTDGTKEASSFPRFISPHQPFMDLQGIRYWRDEIAIDVHFAGDVFETEDQRNWTDASYKTYSTPLQLPFPVEVTSQHHVLQTVRFSVSGLSQNDSISVPTEVPISLEVSEQLDVPKLGVGFTEDIHTLSGLQLERLRALRLSFLRVEVDATDPCADDQLSAAHLSAMTLECQLHVALLLGDDIAGELDRLTPAIQQAAKSISNWFVFSKSSHTTPDSLARIARPILHALTPDADVCGGTDAYFAELNRNRPAAEVLQGIAYSINPQVHAFDDLTLAETLAAQADTVRSAQELYPGLPIHVGPITLKPRFNPNATGAEAAFDADGLPVMVDKRQVSAFLAAWTLGSIASLSAARATTATYFETSGPRGLLGSAANQELPEPFLTSDRDVYPVYHVFADLWELRRRSLQRLTCAEPDQIVGLMFSSDADETNAMQATDESQRVHGALLGNLSNEIRTVRLPFALERFHVLEDAALTVAHQLSSDFRVRWQEADGNTLQLPPHSYTRVEGAQR